MNPQVKGYMMLAEFKVNDQLKKIGMRNKFDLLSDGNTLTGYAQLRERQLCSPADGVHLETLNFAHLLDLYKNSKNDQEFAHLIQQIII